ncbi:dehydrin DHN1-like [Forsythia ovata]|uniref:Dehydrin DHN1-like n=1 Tax=Forsythia ovata TaxID=205694 RepID=A0ABD1WT09_9LAMI
MAEYGEQYGDQMRRTDEYEKPVHHAAGGTTGEYGTTGGTTGEYGTTGGTVGEYGTTGKYGTTGTQGGIGYGTTEDAGLTGEHQGQLRRSGSSSSSSEDDGEGGRRKKGLKDNIKEKLTGGNKEDQTYNLTGGDKEDQTYYSTSTNTNPVSAGYEVAGERNEEKKGMMGKIIDKLPGHNN